MTNIHWRKSTRCGPDNGCVELARLGSQIAVRDSKDRHGSPVLRFGRSAFSSFVADIKLSRSAGRGGSRSSGTTNPAPAPHGVVSAPEQANLPRVAEDRCALPEGAQTEGPCPHCGHHGPRLVLCHNPDCLHSQSMHDLKRNGSRGACSVSTGRKATPCTCTAYVPNPESGGG